MPSLGGLVCEIIVEQGDNRRCRADLGLGIFAHQLPAREIIRLVGGSNCVRWTRLGVDRDYENARRGSLLNSRDHSGRISGVEANAFDPTVDHVLYRSDLGRRVARDLRFGRDNGEAVRLCLRLRGGLEVREERVAELLLNDADGIAAGACRRSWARLPRS